MPHPRVAVAVAVAAAALSLTGCSTAAPQTSASGGSSSASGGASAASAAHASSSAASGTAAPAFDRAAHSVDDPGSIWIVVDKKRPLTPRSWIPPDLVTPDVPHTNVPQLRKAAAAALVAMFAGAKRDGVTVVSLSAYRAYSTQKRIFEQNLATLGRAKTLGLTAKPGYSEHQTGLADDLGDGSGRCGIAVCFAGTPAGTWLAANAWRYGWILRYPSGYGAITGIQSEPWHYRFVGKPLAREMHRTGVRTLEQFFHLPASPDY